MRKKGIAHHSYGNWKYKQHCTRSGESSPVYTMLDQGHHDWVSEKKTHIKRQEVMGHEKGEVSLSHNNALLWEMIYILMGTILMPSQSGSSTGCQFTHSTQPF